MEPLRVLIVDDEEELVSTLVERLEIRGIHAHGVTTGKEALVCLQDEVFDVVLLDVKMPEIGGLVVIREIKERLPDLEVILLTGHGSDEDAQKGLELGAFEYIIKPFNLSVLIDVLHRAAGRDVL
ncbi:MAG: response regulator [Proteobacteria bacterium]|nr:response regulator [Pseudomonadota bacterium]